MEIHMIQSPVVTEHNNFNGDGNRNKSDNHIGVVQNIPR